MNSMVVNFMVVINATTKDNSYIILQWRENILNAAGYKINSIWECQWTEIKKKMSNTKRKTQKVKLLMNILILEIVYLVVELKRLNHMLNARMVKKLIITMLYRCIHQLMHWITILQDLNNFIIRLLRKFQMRHLQELLNVM